jgi:hypothetical protein
MEAIKLFADAGQAVSLGGLTIENRMNRVLLYGSLDLTHDRQGLARARELKALLERIVQARKDAQDLPETLLPPEPPTEVANPFR